MFQDAGYSGPPQIYFVNLNAYQRNFQDCPTRKGVSQLNGYTAAMFQQIMTGDEVLRTLQQDPAAAAAAATPSKKSTEDDFQGKVQDKFYDHFRILMSQTQSGILQHYMFEGHESAQGMLQECEQMLALQHHLLYV